MMYFLIILLAVAICVVLYFGEKSSGFSIGKEKDRPIDILKRRFANGEITEEEYEERVLILKEDEF